jgi:hypothetical protein
MCGKVKDGTNLEISCAQKFQGRPVLTLLLRLAGFKKMCRGRGLARADWYNSTVGGGTR